MAWQKFRERAHTSQEVDSTVDNLLTRHVQPISSCSPSRVGSHHVSCCNISCYCHLHSHFVRHCSPPSALSLHLSLPSQSPALFRLFTPSEFDPFLPNAGLTSETEDLQATVASQTAAACVTYPQTPQPHPSVVQERADRDNEETGSKSSRVFALHVIGNKSCKVVKHQR